MQMRIQFLGTGAGDWPLKKDKNVLEFRRGNYGEGENGVTIVKLK